VIVGFGAAFWARLTPSEATDMAMTSPAQARMRVKVLFMDALPFCGKLTSLFNPVKWI
jgi:hypothetical protein